jgi:hypothetical protein
VGWGHLAGLAAVLLESADPSGTDGILAGEGGGRHAGVTVFEKPFA